ncbi:hypothetical protein AKO1_008264 [Acrasis kona]|uniref:SMP-LTD domain-containing protein n=1 Tax=Acrasis kona TaxID=1008807 RepID=A0AAW2YJ31_9EUKA
MNRTLFYLIILAAIATVYLVIFSFLNYEDVHPQQNVNPVVSTTVQYTRAFFVSIFIVLFFCMVGLVLLLVYLLARSAQPEHFRGMIEKNGQTSYRNVIITPNRPSSTFVKAKEAAGSGDVSWLNIIVRRVAEEVIYKNATKLRDEIISFLNTGIELPDIMGPLVVSDLNFGAEPPKVQTIVAKQTIDELIVDVDLIYEDKDTTLALKTSVNVNTPIVGWLVLPISASVHDIFMHLKLRLSFSIDLRRVHVSLLEQPDFDATFSNELGDRSTIRNIPYITDVINRAIFTKVREILLEPNHLTFELPPLEISLSSKEKVERKEVHIVREVQKEKSKKHSHQVKDDLSSSSSSSSSSSDSESNSDKDKQKLKKRKSRRK